jgi:D-serine deaminase-like pyridoxal phosphate-dependent protein
VTGIARFLHGARRTPGWQPLPLPRPLAVEELPTPALLLDVAALDANVARMARHLSAHGKGARPHAKTHKCPLVAARQLAAGAVGICVAKVSEAEIMASAGIDRLLVTSPLAAVEKMQRFAALAAAGGEVMTVVDDLACARTLASCAFAAGVRAGVVVDVDPDMGRTGVRGVAAAADLVEAVAAEPWLRFAGLQCYAGHVQHVKGHAARAAASRMHWQRAADVVGELDRRGIAVPVVTGGGTGTYDIDCDVACVTDLQVGSYVFMDAQYLAIGGRGGDRFDDFAPSLHVLATAISAPVDGRVTVDAGSKAMAVEAVQPEWEGHPAARFRFAGDEHGILQPGGDEALPRRGECVRFVVTHCDPTVNLHDFLFPHRDGVVSEVWPIAARGCSW